MQLTAKQNQILHLAQKGLKDRQIAEKMGISVRTVQNHFARIFAQTQTSNRVEAILLYINSGKEASKSKQHKANEV